MRCIATLLLAALILAPLNTHAQDSPDIVLALESPPNGGTGAGVDIIRGYVVSLSGSPLVSLDLLFNGTAVPHGSLPCCSSRLDVASVYGPNAEYSGFDYTASYDLFAEGWATLGVRAELASGAVEVVENSVYIVHSGPFSYARSASLPDGECRVEGGDILVGPLTLTDWQTGATGSAHLRLRWDVTRQGFTAVEAGPQPLGIQYPYPCRAPRPVIRLFVDDLNSYWGTNVHACAGDVTDLDLYYAGLFGNAFALINQEGQFVYYEPHLLIALARGAKSAFVIAAVLAHEWGHIWQGQNSDMTDMMQVAKELRADCLAGCYYADFLHRNQQLASTSDLEAAFGTMCLLGLGGAPAWLDPTGHGSCSDRAGWFAWGVLTRALVGTGDLDVTPAEACPPIS